MSTPDIEDMRKSLLRVYPSGVIRSQYILQMSDAQIYAIYKWHKQKKISMNEPRLNRSKRELSGQMSLF